MHPHGNVALLRRHRVQTPLLLGCSSVVAASGHVECAANHSVVVSAGEDLAVAAVGPTIDGAAANSTRRPGIGRGGASPGTCAAWTTGATDRRVGCVAQRLVLRVDVHVRTIRLKNIQEVIEKETE